MQKIDQQDIRWQLRFKNYRDALKAWEDISPRFDSLNELEKDGVIQRFEFTFELALKVMQDYLTYSGYQSMKGPRPSIAQMAQDGIIDPFVWQEILDARNELSHIYNEEKSREYLARITSDFIPALQQFRDRMATAL